MGVGLLRPTNTQSPHPHLSTSTTKRRRQQPHVRGQARAPVREPIKPQEGGSPWELGSSGRPNLHVPTPTRHNTKTTTDARALKRFGATPSARNATGMCTTLGVGLLRPTKPQRPHSDGSQRENDNSCSAWASLDDSPGATKATKKCAFLGTGLHEPTKPPCLHLHFATT